MDFDNAVNICGWLSCGVNNECKQALSIAIKSIRFAKEVESLMKINEFPEYFDEDVRNAFNIMFLKEVIDESDK